MDINYLVEQELNKDNLFDSGKVNENAKYIPFLKRKNKNSESFKLSAKLKSLFKINPKNIHGTDISVDANDEEKEADEYLRKQGLLI